MNYYHMTTNDNAKKILKEGLVPQIATMHNCPRKMKSGCIFAAAETCRIGRSFWERIR